VTTRPGVRPTYWRFLTGLFVAALLLMIILWNFVSHWPSDPRCAGWLAISDQDVAVPLPPNCVESSEATPDALVKYLDIERKQRGLVF